MPKARRSLDPALEALVRERLEGDEIILDWNEGRPGEVVVRLISKKLHRVSPPSPRSSAGARGRAGRLSSSFRTASGCSRASAVGCRKDAVPGAAFDARTSDPILGSSARYGGTGVNPYRSEPL